MSFLKNLFNNNQPTEENKKGTAEKVKKTKMETPIVETKENKAEKSSPVGLPDEEWQTTEGQLTVDVYQTDKEIIVQAPVAGVKPEELDISVDDDVLTIKGERKKTEEEKGKNYYYQECYWGTFSRQIILPTEVDASKIEAVMEKGVLTIKLPIIKKEKRKRISIKDKN